MRMRVTLVLARTALLILSPLSMALFYYMYDEFLIFDGKLENGLGSVFFLLVIRNSYNILFDFFSIPPMDWHNNHCILLASNCTRSTELTVSLICIEIGCSCCTIRAYGNLAAGGVAGNPSSDNLTRGER